MARLPPPPQLPELVEAELGVTEYWLDGGFRRALLIPDEGDCWLLSLDLYAKPESVRGELLARLAAPTAAGTVEELVSLEELEGLGRVELVYLKAGGRLELVEARLRTCRGKPSLERVREIYRRLVLLLEDRDPEVEPLQPPEPVERVYRARLGG